MAPRKQLAPRMRRPRVDDSVERRTKRRNDPAPASSPSSSSPPALRPESPTAVRFSGRVVVPGRKIEFNFFEREHFLIGEWFRHQGWVGFCSLDLPFYPHLVREFYSSLRRGAGSIECIVKGVKIILNDVRIGEILGIPHTGDAPERLQDRADGLRCILGAGDEVGDLDEIRANQLSVEMRILHHMVARIFLPKTGRFDFISERELAFMVYIIRGQPLNLAGIMLHVMREAASRAKVCLPYGMALTLIFRAYGVDLEEEPSKALMNTDTYNDQSLRRMGFRKIQGIWSRGAEGRPQAQGEQLPSVPVAEAGPSSSSAPAADPASPVPAPAPPAPVLDESIIQRMLDSFSDRVMDQFSSLREQVSSTCSRVELLQSEVSSMSARLSALEDRSFDESLRSDIRGILERISALEQRASEPVADEISSLAHEAARLRSVFDSGLVTVQDTYQDLRERHTSATLMFLTDIRRLTERVEEALARPPPPTPASSSRPPFRV